nr:hypothetical protein [Pedobacter sp. ASV19]
MKFTSTQKKEFKLFHDIKELYEHLNLPTSDIHEESDFVIQDLKDVHSKLPYSSGLFRPDFFSFVFVKDSFGSFKTDTLSLAAIPGSVYFAKPRQLRSYIWTKINHASLITVNEKFLKDNVDKNIFREFPFLLTETVGYKVLDQKDYVDFEILYEQIHKEYRSENPYRKRVIGRLFIVLLLRLKDHFWKDLPELKTNQEPKIVSLFKKAYQMFFKNKKHRIIERFEEIP